jgi:hypothetical protein
MSVSEALVREVKPLIERGELQQLEEVLEAYYTSEIYSPTLAWDFILLKVYVHACLKRKPDIANWTLEQTKLLNPIEQSAIRQMVPYGRWLLSRAI